MSLPAASVRIGPAGWTYADWKGVVYPATRSRSFRPLAYMAQLFDVVEINTSFYAPLQPGTAERWLEQIEPYPTFCFTAKLWQRFTHEPEFSPEDERAFRQGLAPSSRRTGWELCCCSSPTRSTIRRTTGAGCRSCSTVLAIFPAW